jgi:hypothetical protein
MIYYASSGPKSGPILYRDHYGVIKVVRRPDELWPIGRAMEVGRTEGGVSLWKLEVRGIEVPGRWIVLGREFLPAQVGRAPR